MENTVARQIRRVAEETKEMEKGNGKDNRESFQHSESTLASLLQGLKRRGENRSRLAK